MRSFVSRRALAGLALAGAALVQRSEIPIVASSETSSGSTIVRVDPRFDALVPPGATLDKIADGFAWVEGPVWDAPRGRLLFSDIPQNAIFTWTPGGTSLFLRPSGYTGARPFTGREPGSNGLVLDREGRLVLCEHGDRRVARLEADGRKTTLADRFRGRRLNSPNDAAYRSNGDLYFTDPPFGLPAAFDDPEKELPFSGVYRLSAAGELTLLTSELRAPNGIAFSPDERALYVTNADPARPIWMAFDHREDGTLGRGRVVFDGTRWTGRWKGSADGMKVDRHGNIFAAGPGGVHVFGPDWTHLGSVITGGATSNVAWGEEGSLFVTAGTAVYRIRLAAGVGQSRRSEVSSF